MDVVKAEDLQHECTADKCATTVSCQHGQEFQRKAVEFMAHDPMQNQNGVLSTDNMRLLLKWLARVYNEDDTGRGLYGYNNNYNIYYRETHKQRDYRPQFLILFTISSIVSSYCGTRYQIIPHAC